MKCWYRSFRVAFTFRPSFQEQTPRRGLLRQALLRHRPVAAVFPSAPGNVRLQSATRPALRSASHRVARLAVQKLTPRAVRWPVRSSLTVRWFAPRIRLTVQSAALLAQSLCATSPALASSLAKVSASIQSASGNAVRRPRAPSRFAR